MSTSRLSAFSSSYVAESAVTSVGVAAAAETDRATGVLAAASGLGVVRATTTGASRAPWLRDDRPRLWVRIACGTL